MARYRLSTGLFEATERPECSSDKEAWERLRVHLLGKYATLYKEENLPVKVVNRDAYLKSFNSKYTSQQYDLKNPTRTEWIPVLVGITNDEYDIVEQNNPSLIEKAHSFLINKGVLSGKQKFIAFEVDKLLVEFVEQLKLE